MSPAVDSTHEPLAITAFEPHTTADDNDLASFEVQRRAARERHRFMLIACSIALALSFVLRLDDGGAVAAKSWSLPPLCGSRALFGIECPGCGLTRSWVALAHGDLQRSLAFHRLGWLMFAAAAAQLVYRPWMIYQLRTKLPAHRWPTWFGYFLIAALFANWMLKMATTM